MIRPWLFLSRYRIYGAIAVTILVLLLFAFATNLFSSDLSCDCPGSTRTSLNLLWALSILPAILGYVFGFSINTAAASIPGVNSYPRFLLTRPISRTTILCAPILICFATLILLPPVMTAFFLGCLQLFHPAGISHLFTILNLIPAVHVLGPHPSLIQLLLAIDLPRRYAAGISVGLCAYTLMASQRWLVLNPSRNLQYLSLIPGISILAPTILQFLSTRVTSALLLIPRRGAELTYLPSTFGIGLHFAIAAAITFGCWRIMRTAEI